jgi:NADH dehydrogenase
MKRQTSLKSSWRVIIVGGGFGGLGAARALKSHLFDVTLIDRRDYHLYQPLLNQVATGSLAPGQISAPLKSLLSKQKNTRVLLGSVEDVDPGAKQVFLADGAVLAYDSLIVATGSQPSYFGNDDWQQWAPGLKSVEEATVVRDKILRAFEVAERIPDPVQRRAWLTFVIVGAGPTGVELAGAISEIARRTLKNDSRSIRPEECQIILLDGAPRVLMSYPDDLAEKATRSLTKLGVTLRCGAAVKDINSEGVTIKNGENLDHLTTRTVIWAGGNSASSLGQILARRTNADTDKRGRVKVKPDLTIPNYPDIYVIGGLLSRYPRKTLASIDAGGRAGRAVCGQGNLPKSEKSAGTRFLSVLRQGLASRDRTPGGSGQCLRSSSLRPVCLDPVGLYPRDESFHLPESAFGFRPMGIPGLDVQSWSAACRRYRPDGF